MFVELKVGKFQDYAAHLGDYVILVDNRSRPTDLRTLAVVLIAPVSARGQDVRGGYPSSPLATPNGETMSEPPNSASQPAQQCRF